MLSPINKLLIFTKWIALSVPNLVRNYLLVLIIRNIEYCDSIALFEGVICGLVIGYIIIIIKR